MLKKFLQNNFFRFKKHEAKIHDLNYLFWECTLRCNLNCLHCGSDCLKDSTYRDMPFTDFINAIKPLLDVYKKNSIFVVITGGEPLLRKDLAECGFNLRKEGFRWGIVTNGFQYTKEKHNELLSAGMGAITLSLDGLEKSHNWLRNNQNSFARTVSALELITSSKRLNSDIVTCVNKRNISELPELKKFLVQHKTKAWRLFSIAPIGRAKNNSELSLNSNQFIELMQFIANERKKNEIDIKFSCEGYVWKYEKKVRSDYFFCHAGINIASVLINGSISACPNIDRSFSQGNIYKDDLLKTWQEKFQLMRDRDWCRVGECANCKQFKYCQGNGMHLWDSHRQNVLMCHYKLCNSTND